MRAGEAQQPAPYRAVILTALAVEYVAVRAHLKELREEAHSEGTLYERGHFSAGGSTWDVLLVEVGAGNSQAAFETERALRHFQPDVALFVGVAGGLKDVSLGDVVIAYKVYGYESGKARLEFEPRPDVGESSYVLVQRARMEARHGNWLRRLSGLEPIRMPRAHLGAIAAGEKVVAGTRSAVHQFLRRHYGDALAVEMEGRGFLVAAHANRRVDALVIRGISDLIDGKAEVDAVGSQELASRHASAFAFELLARFKPSVEPTSRATQVAGNDGVWTVPYPRNPNFTGRSMDLQALRTHFLADPARPRPLALFGLGGVGKTQLAVEYAGRHAADARDYTHVLWVRADEPSVLASDYAALTGPLGLPERVETEHARKEAAVQRWLKQHDGWLLVFDNAESVKHLAPYLPVATRGHVLITSRNPAWSELATPRPVETLERAEAVAFLHKRTRQEDAETASMLAEALGDLPLALSQSAAYIEQTGRSLRDYLALFAARYQELLARPGAPVDYPHTVAATWTLSFEQVSAQSPAGAALLALCAFLESSPIPCLLLSRCAAGFPEPLASAAGDALHLDEAISALRRYSLVQTHEDLLLFHPLVQGVMRARLSEEEQRGWAETALRLMSRSFVFDDTNLSSWVACQLLLPHALAAARHAWQRAAGHALLSTLHRNIGGFWREQAEYGLARQVLEAGLEALQLAPDADPLTEVGLHQELGHLALELGEHARAEASFERAWRCIEAMPPGLAQQRATATLLNDLSVLACSRGRHQEALEYARRVQALDEAGLEEDSPERSAHLTSQSTVLFRMGMFEQALVCARQALAISKDCFGTPHPRVAIALNNLARMLEECGHHAEALEPLQQAREMSESIYGAGHPQMATVLVGLGSLYRKLGNLPEARQCCERALSIAEASLGPDHVEVAIALATLSHVLYSQRELTAARSAAERAVAILGCMEDSDPSHLAEALAGLACMQEEQGAREQAILTQERAIALYERVLGANHPDIATLLRNLGMFHLRAGELGRALPLFERALAIDDLVDGSRSPRIVQERLICAQGLFQAGAHEPAVQLVHRVLSLCAGLETVPSSTFEDVLGLGKALVDRGDWALSKTLLARTLRLEDRLAPDEAQRAELRVLLGTALVRGERPEPPPAELDEAKRLLEQALGAERVLSAEMLTRTLNELGYIFGVRGELSEARACFERALAIVEAHPPPDSHPVAAIALQLGKVLVAQQDYSAAHPHITRAWSLCERHLKQDHPEFELMRREACVYLGEVLLRLGKYRLALQHLEKARNLVVKAVGMEHPGSAYNLMQIALCHAGLGKPWKALPKLKRALEMLERREGPEHPLAREIRVWIQRLSG